MSLIFIFDPGHPNERVLSFRERANTTEYLARSDVVIYEDAAAFPVLVEPQPYWRHDAGAIRDMNSTEKGELDAERAAAALAARRDGAKASIAALSSQGQILRAIVLLLVDELNVLRTLHGLPDRTGAQARTAIENLIEAGDAD